MWKPDISPSIFCLNKIKLALNKKTTQMTSKNTRWRDFTLHYNHLQQHSTTYTLFFLCCTFFSINVTTCQTVHTWITITIQQINIFSDRENFMVVCQICVVFHLTNYLASSFFYTSRCCFFFRKTCPTQYAYIALITFIWLCLQKFNLKSIVIKFKWINLIVNHFLIGLLQKKILCNVL